METAAAETYLRIDRALCLSCGACVAVCPAEALLLKGLELLHDPEACVLCGECAPLCPTGAITAAAREGEAR